MADRKTRKAQRFEANVQRSIETQNIIAQQARRAGKQSLDRTIAAHDALATAVKVTLGPKKDPIERDLAKLPADEHGFVSLVALPKKRGKPKKDGKSPSVKQVFKSLEDELYPKKPLKVYAIIPSYNYEGSGAPQAVITSKKKAERIVEALNYIHRKTDMSYDAEELVLNELPELHPKLKATMKLLAEKRKKEKKR